MAYSKIIKFYNPDTSELGVLKFDEVHSYASGSSNCSSGSNDNSRTIEEAINDFRKWLNDEEEFQKLESYGPQRY